MVIVSVGGVAVSLGFVVTQFLGGLSYNYGVEVGDIGTILVTVGLTVGFTASAALGVKRGIRRVSTFNMYLFVTLLVVAFVFGPTMFLVNNGTEALGGYANNFVSMSLYANAANGGEWVGAWTIFYWAWWFSFAPMIGIFIARICRGRTIRQVVFAGLIGTTAASFPWFIVMGGSSLWVQTQGNTDLLSIVFEQGREVAAFPLFETLIPFGGVFAVAYLVLVLTFLITTVDSTTLSLAMFTTDGSTHPSTINRVLWGGLVGCSPRSCSSLAVSMRSRTSSSCSGFPIAFVIGLCFIGLTIELERTHPVLLTERYKESRSRDRGPTNGRRLSLGAPSRLDGRFRRLRFSSLGGLSRPFSRLRVGRILLSTNPPLEMVRETAAVSQESVEGDINNRRRRFDITFCVTLPNSAFPVGDRCRPPMTTYRASCSSAYAVISAADLRRVPIQWVLAVSTLPSLGTQYSLRFVVPRNYRSGPVLRCLSRGL